MVYLTMADRMTDRHFCHVIENTRIQVCLRSELNVVVPVFSKFVEHTDNNSVAGQQFVKTVLFQNITGGHSFYG